MSKAIAKRKKKMGKGLINTSQKKKKKNHTNSHRHMRRCSILLTIREMQIKTITTISMYIINNTENNRCWQECGETGILKHCHWECKMMWLLWETQRFLKKLNTELL